jgi:hypothetical protein
MVYRRRDDLRVAAIEPLASCRASFQDIFFGLLPVSCGQHFLHFVGDSIVPRKSAGAVSQGN